MYTSDKFLSKLANKLLDVHVHIQVHVHVQVQVQVHVLVHVNDTVKV